MFGRMSSSDSPTVCRRAGSRSCRKCPPTRAGCGPGATLVGFIDDVRHLRPAWNLLAQAILAAWVLLAFGAQPLFHLPASPGFLDLALSWLALVWLMNLYNFIDGIDGMAATGAIFVSIAAILVLVVGGPQKQTAPELGLIFGLIAVSSLGFLIFNRPPATIFMGDSGSLFLGFAFAALITKTVVASHISAWTWLIIFG